MWVGVGAGRDGCKTVDDASPEKLLSHPEL